MAFSQLLSSQEALLLVIDPQTKLLPVVFEPERVSRNIILLLRFAKIVGLPVVATTQYEKGIGPIVEPIRKELPQGPTIDKLEFGCFSNPKFVHHINHIKGERNSLILAGIESHICVMQTAMGAIEHGYNVHVAADAVSSRTEQNWKAGLKKMETAGVSITSTEMALFEILKRSDSPHFKTILPDLREPVR